MDGFVNSTRATTKENENPLKKVGKDSGLDSITDSKPQTIEEAVLSNDDDDDDATQINSDDFRLLNDDILANQAILRKEFSKPTYWDEKFTLISPQSKEKVEAAVQTDLLLPAETSPFSFKVLTQVNILKGMLMARDWALDKQNVKVVNVHDLLKRSNTDYLVGEEVIREMDGVIRENRNTKYEDTTLTLIDLTSSPDHSLTASINQCLASGTVKFRKNNDYVREVLRYSLLRPTPEDPIAGAFQTVLQYVKEEVLKNSQYIIENWVGSLVEAAADVLLKTADIEGSVSCQLLVEFCEELLDKVTREDHYHQKNNNENYISIILKICDSVTVSFAVVDSLLQKLTEVEEFLDGPGYRLVDHVYVIESAYFIVCILYTILTRIKEQYKKGSAGHEEHILPNKINQGVLHLWKRHWRPTEQEAAKPTSAPSSKLEFWQETLESILRTSFLRSPILSPVLMNCLETIKIMAE